MNKSKHSYKLAAKLALTGLIAVSSMTALSHSNVHAAAASASTNSQEG
ncbi:hypothetical protein [Paenibacillus montanisoli]|nr:hypothetical protein [Paenibacillus montanisoli]